MQNKMVNKYKKKIISIAVIAYMMIVLTGCGKMSLYAEPDSTYKEISDVPGISFSIPSSVTQATAINRITPEMEFDSSTTYSYKDGANTFLVFNMDNIVILCEKGTGFDFDMIPKGEDKEAGLKNSPIVSTWLSQRGKTFNYKEGLKNGVYKLIGDVKAQVSITTRVFGDFTGQLAVVTDGVTEYALFIGAPDELYDNLGSGAEEIIETVVKSLKMTYVEAKEDVSDSASVASSETGNDEKEASAEISANTESTENAVEEASIEISVSENVDTSAAEESSCEEEKEPQIEEKESSEKEDITTKKSGLELDNQNDTAVESEGSYYSNVYSALKIGDSGKFISINDSAKALPAIVTVTNHYGKVDAEKIIKRYCASGKAPYEYTDAPEGTHWEAVEYSIDKTGTEGMIYANVKLTGLDGKKLYFKGIGYTPRTYDISYLVNKEGDVETGYISYYAVPNGCTEYMLVVGDGNDSNGVAVYNAYYDIKTD
jgi:hypothetical protein